MRLHDTHCHLSDRAFRADVDVAIERARAAGVEAITVPGYDAATNEGTFALAERYPWLLPAIGFHPHEAASVSQTQLADLETAARDERVVAIGELGLDFYRNLSPHDVQRRLLDDQLGIATRLGKPVLVHSRSAEEAIEPHLAAYAAASPLPAAGRPPGVMHCFGGTVEQARRYIALGFLVSIPCTITYPKSDGARALARELPLDSLVVETDSPYLPPQGWRGKRNEPAHVARAVEAIAAERDEPVAHVAEATWRNAARLVGLREHIGAGAC